MIFINRYFHPDLSATSEMLSDLAFALSELGMSVTIITSRLRYEDGKALYSPSEIIRGVQIHRVWTSQFGRFLLLGRSLDYLSFFFAAGWRLWRLARAGDVVVAKTDPPLLSVMAAAVPRRGGGAAETDRSLHGNPDSPGPGPDRRRAGPGRCWPSATRTRP